MPVLGHVEEGDVLSYAFADQLILSDGLTNVLNAGDAGGVQVGPKVLVPDFTPEQSAVAADLGSTLHDRVAGNAWLLNRIVGKLHFACHSNQGDVADPDVTWAGIYLTFGIFVARAKDDNQGVADLTPKEADPTQVDNQMNPWVFRRSWILSNPLFVAVNGNVPQWPSTTSGYGSMADGPHIDSKSKRIIQREHRLFYVVNARGYDGRTLGVSGDTTLQPSFSGLLDLRVYGALRGGHQKNSSF